MKFEAVRCDECGRIQGESNHWVKIVVFEKDADGGTVGVALGPMIPYVMGISDFSSAIPYLHDLCGQGCATKHIAKLLGWSMTNEAQS